MNTEEVAAIVVSSHDHFIALSYLQRPQCQFDGECAAAAGEDMLDLKEASQALLQPLDVSAMIAAPGTITIRRLHGCKDGFICNRPVRRPLWSNRFATQNRRQAAISRHRAVLNGGIEKITAICYSPSGIRPASFRTR